MTAAGDVSNAAAFDAATNPPGVVATRTAAQSIPTGGTATAISFDGEEFDNGGMITPTSGTITIGADGVYCVTAAAVFASNTAGLRSLELWLNGIQIEGQIMTAVNGSVHRIAYSNHFLLAALDTIELRVFQSSGGALNITSARAGCVRATG